MKKFKIARHPRDDLYINTDYFEVTQSGHVVFIREQQAYAVLNPTEYILVIEQRDKDNGT